jgi:DNA-binding NarL/FixJ family response regulator
MSAGLIKILMIDDHAMVRLGFRWLLANAEDIELVAEAERAEQAFALYQQYQADIVIMDLSMPGIGGLEAIRRLCQRYPNIKILVFSIHDEPIYWQRAFKAGAKGYMTKNSASELMLEAIYCLAQGDSYLEPALSDQQINYQDLQQLIEQLSAREFDILRLLIQGLSPPEIAKQLCLSYKTVANYITQIKSKFCVNTTIELSRIIQVSGLI